MLTLDAKNRYKKALKLCHKRGKDISKLIRVVEMLQHGEALPSKHRPHKLVGNHDGEWECHIEPDWLLIYRVSDTTLTLFDTGTHADLF